jgi:hypothetical protein
MPHTGSLPLPPSTSIHTHQNQDTWVDVQWSVTDINDFTFSSGLPSQESIHSTIAIPSPPAFSSTSKRGRPSKGKYKCNFRQPDGRKCEHRFTRNYNLVNHLKTHTEVSDAARQAEIKKNTFKRGPKPHPKISEAEKHARYLVQWYQLPSLSEFLQRGGSIGLFKFPKVTFCTLTGPLSRSASSSGWHCWMGWDVVPVGLWLPVIKNRAQRLCVDCISKVLWRLIILSRSWIISLFYFILFNFICFSFFPIFGSVTLIRPATEKKL